MSDTVPASANSASRPHSPFYDVIIIGAGVTGCAAAYELAKTSLSILVLEKEADAAFGISSRNSGVVHSGIHYKPGTLRARFNVEGNHMMEELCEHLRVPFTRTGKLTAAADDTETEQLEVLMEQGNANGVPGLQILDHAGMSRLQPGISGKAALYSPTTGIISPYGLTIALGEHARENGAAFRFLHQVTGIEHLHGAGSDVRFRIEAQETGTRKVPLSSSGYQETVHFTCSAVINCAGLFSDQNGRMAGIDEYTIYPCRESRRTAADNDDIPLHIRFLSAL